jgi:uroporphyrinogen decarboxylase
MEFTPDYSHLENAARNIATKRAPLYDHSVDIPIIEKIINKEIKGLYSGNETDRNQYFKQYCDFFKLMGYDTVTFECCITQVVPNGGALAFHKPGAIKDRADFEKYPWDEVEKLFFDRFASDYDLMIKNLPAGMKAVGGPGNGVFELVQDLTGYTDLCYMSIDDPELYAELFAKVGEVMFRIWEKFMKLYSDGYCVLRFGDDLGFKNQTLIPGEQIKTLIIPQYKKIIDLVHSYNKPFLLHSCGQIFDVMDDLINIAGINAKHSNEDAIVPFSKWVEVYGDRIGNFGGIDTDVICKSDEKFVKEYTQNVYRECIGKGGVAFGSGNSVPDYVSVEGYMAMNNAIRELRGDFTK